MYFDKFPYTTFIDGKEETIVCDFVSAIDMIYNPTDYPDLFTDYYMQDGEKIENVAYSFYGSTDYHWVLIYINGIKDPYNDLPQRDFILRESCAEIYGSLDGLHHYESASNAGEVVDFLHSPSIRITNVEHMIQENEKKRKIKVLRNQYLSDFVSMYIQKVQT
jgi:hypothetical protein